MPVLAIIISGIVGTLVMTGAVYLFSLMDNKVMKVPKILGTMLTFSTTPNGGLCKTPVCISIGTMAHYAMGIFFIFCYYLLWRFNVGKPDIIYAFLFGVIHGLVGMLIWSLFFKLHPRPPHVALANYLWSLMVGHLFFALSATVTFNMINQLVNIGEIQP